MAAVSVRDVFDSIARCPNVNACYSSDRPNPCKAIVDYQRTEWHAETYSSFQLPEPWMGQIDRAKLLFIASNPSIGDDKHSIGSSSADTVWEAHQLAFGGGKRTYIIDGVKTTKPDGSVGHKVHYWSAIRARAHELLPDAVPGTDYAITELVHCKSKGEIGVARALDECRSRHFERVFSVAAARVVIALGSFASKCLLEESGSIPPDPVEQVLGGAPRLLLFLPHPSSFIGPKTLRGRYSSEALSRVMQFLAEGN
jgi:uracil-DNA glycosylase